MVCQLFPDRLVICVCMADLWDQQGQINAFWHIYNICTTRTNPSQEQCESGCLKTQIINSLCSITVRLVNREVNINTQTEHCCEAKSNGLSSECVLLFEVIFFISFFEKRINIDLFRQEEKKCHFLHQGEECQVITHNTHNSSENTAEQASLNYDSN